MPPGASPGLRDAGRELARRILPFLLARLDEGRDRLREVVGVIEEDPERALADEAVLARTEVLGGRDRAFGWALGVLAATTGADLLGVRRERDGVRLLAGLVAEAGGCVLEPDPSALPAAGSAVGEGWELALAVAFVFLEALRANPRQRVLRWSLERSAPLRTFSCPDVARPSYARETWAEILAQMPGASLVEGAGSLRLAIPEIWFEKEEDEA